MNSSAYDALHPFGSDFYCLLPAAVKQQSPGKEIEALITGEERNFKLL